MQATKFISGITGKLAERWVATLFTPAFVFWAGGGIVALQVWGWDNPVRNTFKSLSDSLQITTLIALLLAILISGFIIERFDMTALRWLEGYWPRWLRPLRRALLNCQKRAYNQREKCWQTLKTKESKATLTPDEAGDLAQIDWRHSRLIPAEANKRMPTELGNILRSAELGPTERYGLNTVLCWPHLWMVIPEHVRQNLSAARADLNTAVRIWLWSCLFCLWALLAIWARPFQIALWPLPLGFLSAWFSYRWAISAAIIYGSLLQAAFDLYRFNLYEALHLNIPQSPNDEKQKAEALNQYLLRGY